MKLPIEPSSDAPSAPSGAGSGSGSGSGSGLNLPDPSTLTSGAQTPQTSTPEVPEDVRSVVSSVAGS